MPRGRRSTLLSLAAAAALLAGCFGCASSTPRPTRTLEAAIDPSGLQRVNVHLHSYYFDPDRIQVHVGHPVELVLHNHSMVVPHNFTIVDSGLSITQNVGLKRTHIIRFTPDRPGEFEFFCHVGSHAKKGMKGVLVVVP